MNDKNKLIEYINEHVKAVTDFSINNNLNTIVKEIIEGLQNGGKVYAFGNGGSAAEASHFVGELIGRFENGSRVPYRAICLNTDMTVITAIANDYSYNDIFSRQVRGLVTSRDIVIGFSTSGNSVNILTAIEYANSLGATTIGFTGSHDDNRLEQGARYNVVAPSKRTCIIQEIHQIAIHYIAKEVERILE